MVELPLELLVALPVVLSTELKVLMMVADASVELLVVPLIVGLPTDVLAAVVLPSPVVLLPVVLLSVVLPSVVLLSVVLTSVVLSRVVLLSIVLPSVVLLFVVLPRPSVVLLSVVGRAGQELGRTEAPA